MSQHKRITTILPILPLYKIYILKYTYISTKKFPFIFLFSIFIFSVYILFLHCYYVTMLHKNKKILKIKGLEMEG